MAPLRGQNQPDPTSNTLLPLLSGDSVFPTALVRVVEEIKPGGCLLAVLPDVDRHLDKQDLVVMDSYAGDWMIGLDLTQRTSGLALITPGQVIGTGQRVTAVAVVHKSGSSSLHVFDERDRPEESELVASNVEGLVPDAMRRALGLTTPAPQIDPSWYWTFRWLQELHYDGVVASPEILDLDDVICAHPAIEPGELDGMAWLTLGEFCRERHFDHSQLTGWGGIRSSFLRSQSGPAGPSELERAARWHDDGSFSRWFVSKQPTLAEVFDTVSVVLDPSAADLVGGVVQDVLERSVV